MDILWREEFGAGNETRTRDPDLGKVVLYQLSYSRLGGLCFTALSNFGAGNETRTRDPDLGKVVLYQLSYSRVLLNFAFVIFAFLRRYGRENNLERETRLELATPTLARSCSTISAIPAWVVCDLQHFSNFGEGNETRTRDPDLGKVVLYQLSYSRLVFVFLTASALAAFTHLSHILL